VILSNTGPTTNCYEKIRYDINKRYAPQMSRAVKLQESPADADKPARRKSMQKLLQFDVFRFISQNSISPNFKLPMRSVGRYV